MFYDTIEGIEELRSIHENIENSQNKSKIETDDQWNESTEEIIDKRKKTRRRTEVSMLADEKNSPKSSPKKSRRTPVARWNLNIDGLQRIDEFIAKKKSPIKSKLLPNYDHSLLPSASIKDQERCPICERLIPNDILEVHTNACIVKNTQSAKLLLDKVKERTNNETKVKERLFQRATRQNVVHQLTKHDSETTTCTSCGMQMTVSHLENQHKESCSKSFQ